MPLKAQVRSKKWSKIRAFKLVASQVGSVMGAWAGATWKIIRCAALVGCGLILVLLVATMDGADARRRAGSPKIYVRGTNIDEAKSGGECPAGALRISSEQLRDCIEIRGQILADEEEDRVCLKKLDSIKNRMDIERDVLRYTGLVRVYNLMLEPRRSFIAGLNHRISRLNDSCADRCYFTEDYSAALLESQRKVDEFGKNNILVRYCDTNFSPDPDPSEKSRP